MIYITTEKVTLQDLFNKVLNDFFLGSYPLFYFVLFVCIILLSGLVGTILRKLKQWDPVPFFSAGNTTNYFQERWMLKTRNENIIEWMALVPTFFFGFFAIGGLTLSLIDPFIARTIDNIHLFYQWLVFILCFGWLTFTEIDLTRKTLPRYRLFISKQSFFLSYLENTLELPLKSLLSTQQTQDELEKLSHYNGRAKKILKKYLLELVDSI